jgi:hypothetical protein
LDSPAGKLYQYGKQVASGEVDDDSLGLVVGSTRGLQSDDRKAWQFRIRTWLKVCLTQRIWLLPLNKLCRWVRRWRLNQLGAKHKNLGCLLVHGNNVYRICTFDPDLPVWVGIDMALKHDTIAVCVAQPQEIVLLCGKDLASRTRRS